jgi:signal transduction histidine kinase
VHARNRTTDRTGMGTGLGLVGLAERVDLLGGTLRHGPTGDGHYDLVATLPVVREPA